MSYKTRIIEIEDELNLLRKKWVTASKPMRILIEREAKELKGQLKSLYSTRNRLAEKETAKITY